MEPNELVNSLVGLKIPSTHATVGLSNLLNSHKKYRTLFVNRRLPDHGWSDLEIQHLLLTLATLDTNHKHCTSINDSGNYESDDEDDAPSPRWCGVGEREGRVFSSLVASRHFGLSHGTGRSGDITEPQPKAVGSSVLVQLTLRLVLDAVRRGSGLDSRTTAAHGILLPLCTGMTMSLVLSRLRQQQEQEPLLKPRNIVLWSRIDQKSCFKAITAAGLQCVVIPTTMDGDQVVTDLVELQQALSTTYVDQVLAVITTTSCFAPRVPDQVDQVAQLCAQQNVAHVINHAYGLQCAKTCKLLNRACAVGRVDAVVCSTDKNFLVPVGGALVLSPHAAMVEGVGQAYAGRASSAPMVDLFITLLSMGLKGYQTLLKNRMELLPHFSKRLSQVAEKHGERLLQCPSNTISFGITLDTLVVTKDKDSTQEDDVAQQKEVSALGAMLFSRCVSGTRVVPRHAKKIMGGQTFEGFGSSTNDFPHVYMTAACAIGLGTAEMKEFCRRLDKTMADFKKKQLKKKKTTT